MHFSSQYDSRVVIYKRKMFIRLVTGSSQRSLYRFSPSVNTQILLQNQAIIWGVITCWAKTFYCFSVGPCSRRSWCLSLSWIWSWWLRPDFERWARLTGWRRTSGSSASQGSSTAHRGWTARLYPLFRPPSPPTVPRRASIPGRQICCRTCGRPSG